MKRHLLGGLLAVATFAFITTISYGQGVTTASMTGKVTDANGDALPGATVIAVHTPSGSQYGNLTDGSGFFRLPAMRVGGPYTLKVNFIGYDEFKREGINLSLGQTQTVNIQMSENIATLQEVVIQANNAIIDGNRTGAETALTVDDINEAPTVGRSLGDYARFNPQTSINEGGDGLEISIGGMNNRFNSIYIDGAVNNDVFGLAASGTNGGQTGVSPISIDAIEQFTVSVAPFDVRQSGFAGGAINAVTRSGTNEFEGSAYYLFRNQNLAGKTPFEDGQEDDIEREKLAEFTAKTYGMRLGGPIVKDKVFFFVNAELQRDETPQPFNFNNYRGDLTQGDIDNLVNFLQTRYGYDPGSYLNNTAFLNSDKLIGKFDINLSKNHKLTVRHSYTKAENLEARRSTSSTIGFLNGSEYLVSKTNSSAVELRSLFGNSMSNHLTIGATFVRDDRDPFGDPFPAVFIDDNSGGISFGSETFSTANLLDQDIITINNNLELYKGRHTILIGANAEFYKTKNLFIPFNYGDYNYSRVGSINSVGPSFYDDFLNERPASTYIFSYGLNSTTNGDETTGAAAEFNSSQFGLYVQDEFQANDKLKLTLGLRADINFYEDTPENPFFNDPNTLAQFPYDLKGAQTGQFIDPQISWSPRLGFNYDVKGDRTFQLRGGVGLFTSRIPLVWPGAAYNNTGLNTGFDFERIDFTTPPALIPDVNNQPRNIAVGDLQPSGNVDLFAKDFKVPQVLKFNLAADKFLGNGFVGTFEGIYTKFINNVYYENINVSIPTDRAEGADNRFINYDDDIDGTYGRVILGSNTSEGYTYNLSASLAKDFENGLKASLSYAYGDAWTIYDGTSSQNSSQWRGLHAINGRNFWNQTQRSDFAQGSRVLLNLSYKKEYLGFASTQISLVYEGQSGNPYSYIYGNGDDITGEDSRNRELVYVPSNPNEIVFGEFNGTLGEVVLADDATALAQWEALNAFIEGDDYLRERRGQYAERNQSRTPFENIVDLRILQNFYIDMSNGKRNTIQLSFDIFNFTNLLNKEWGRRYNRTQGGYELLQFEGFEEGTDQPVYSFNGFDQNKAYYGDLDDAGVLSSRWQMQVGVRYIFGGN